MKKKIAILGCTQSRKDAPWKDDEWEIWACNEMEVERADLWFEMHPMNVQNKRELRWLKECEQPVYVLKKTKKVPMGIVYPLIEILQQPWSKKYFTCTFAYEIALAIHEGRKTIGLWGLDIDCGSPRERTIESACIQWWLGVAYGRGIEIIWPGDPANHRWLYGYDYFSEKYTIESEMARLACSILYRNVLLDKSANGVYEPIRRKAT